MTDCFWVDAQYDRDNASDGVSRYGAYVRQATFEPWTDEGRAVELAVFAWRRATPPVMAPGYVRRHPRILSARLERDDYEGSLVAAIEILTNAPSELRGARLPGDGYWRDWPTEWSFGSDRDLFRDPSGEDLARGGRYMLGSVTLQFKMTSDLPGPPAGGADVATCKEAVEILVAELNVIVGPVIDRIERN